MTSAQLRVNTNKQGALRQKIDFLTLAHTSRLSLRVGRHEDTDGEQHQA